MARNYDVKGSKELLYWSIGLFLLCIWAVRDGWFPPPSKILRHGPPEEAEGTFYIFNQTLAVISFIAAVVCGVIYKVQQK